MLKRIFSNGMSIILVTSVFYLLAILVVMFVVIGDYDVQSAEKVESVFWASLILGFGIVVLVIVQFCLNMYAVKPVGDFRAATIVIGNAFVAGLILRYFVSISIGG